MRRELKDRGAEGGRGEGQEESHEERIERSTKALQAGDKAV